jgi:hypothetical protein
MSRANIPHGEVKVASQVDAVLREQPAWRCYVPLCAETPHWNECASRSPGRRPPYNAGRWFAWLEMPLVESVVDATGGGTNIDWTTERDDTRCPHDCP